MTYETIALIAAIILPFWNIPLIAKIIKRKSSKDISLSWTFGVWICFIIMAPSAISSGELIWKVFTGVNLVMFTAVVICVLMYRK
ncbi:MAG: hypothetical protein ABII23_09090 [bacterium]